MDDRSIAGENDLVGGRDLGRCSVRVGCFVSLLVVDMVCSTGIVRACGGVDEDVAIE